MSRNTVTQIPSQTVLIANGQTTSAVIDLRGMEYAGLKMPAVFTGATISFTVSDDNATFQALYDTSNALVSLTVAASRNYQLPASLLAWPYAKIVSASAEGAQRTLVVVGKG